MNNEKNKWIPVLVVVAFLALALGITSLVMTLLSRNLEQQNSVAEATPAASESPYWVPEEETRVINVFAAGAANLTSADLSRTDYTDSFAYIQEAVANYDIACYSQKSLVGSEVSTGFADQMESLGFNMAGLANPTALAYGKNGIDTSMAYWLQSAVRVSGTNVSTEAQNSLKLYEVNGITAIFLSYTDSLEDEIPDNENYLVNVYDDEKTPLFVNKASEMADIVIVDIFWDGDQGALPNDRQKQVAEALAGAGASIIIGNAPDAVQPVCWIDDTLVFYSLGNLISDDETDVNRIGALGAVTVTKTTVGNSHRIELTNPKVDLIVSVEEDDDVAVKFFSNVTADEIEYRDDLYEGYTKTLHRMDDSIRIGGME